MSYQPLYSSKSHRFQHFRLVHQIQPFLKETYREAWNKEYEWLDKTSSYKFRQDISLTPWFLRYWQLASNRFYPKRNKNLVIGFSNSTSKSIIKGLLMNERIKCICLNDTILCDDEKYKELRPQLIELFESKYPKKSAFEK
jgi:hypothetical protein